MDNIILTGDRISGIGEELTRTNEVARHASSSIWKRASDALKVSFSRPFNPDWQVKTYVLVICQVLFATIFLFLMALE